MRAVVKYAKGVNGYGMRDVARPVPASDELLLEVKTAGICGTDLHIIQDEYPHSRPVILGHEYVAVVAGMGEEVQGFELGDTAVSLACAYTCGDCKYCSTGHQMMCPDRRSIGSWRNGAMGQYIVVPARSCFKLEGAPTPEMAVYEPVACCARSVYEIGEVQKDDVVLVSGAGFMGQICMQLCKLAGARVVMAGLPRDKERLLLARSLGADDTATTPDEIVSSLENLGEAGFTLSFECAAAVSSLENCIRFSAKHGRIVQVGLYGKSIPVDMDGALYKELRLLTSFGSNLSSWQKMLEVVRSLTLKPFLHHILSLSQWEQAFADAGSGEYYKVLMRIDEEERSEEPSAKTII